MPHTHPYLFSDGSLETTVEIGGVGGVIIGPTDENKLSWYVLMACSGLISCKQN